MASPDYFSWQGKDWIRCFSEHLPGYDPFAEAGDNYVLDVDRANKAVQFFHCLKLIEGAKANKPFVLEDWQKAIIGCVFGWIDRETEMRRYRELFVYVPRKNGKTPLAAGMVLYGLVMDREAGAQIYSAAAEKEQAALTFRHASGMVAAEPFLEAYCKVNRSYKSITVQSDNAFYKALSADAHTKHGFSTHMCVVDELHAHRDGELVDVLESSTGARDQPLMIYITTADYHRPSVCNIKHDYACKVRDGLIKDASFLPVIYEAQIDEDWTDPRVWERVNPNLDVSLRRDYLERECRKAQEEPTAENKFKRLHLNIKTEQDVRWIPMDAWRRCGKQPVLEGPAYGGLDLASTTDIAAFALFFPETYSLMVRFWIPKANAARRQKRDRVPYLTWAKQGLITMTEGDVIDYKYIRKEINDLARQFEIRKIGYDPYNATTLALQLQDDDGLPMAEHRQGYISMNEPSKLFERAILAGDLKHGSHEVLDWMASNVTVRIDPSDNIRPDKQRSAEKIDGIVAAIMATGLGLNPEPETSGPNFMAI